MLDEEFVTLEIGKTKHIALVAHDGKKQELVDWCDRNKEILKGPFSLRDRDYGQAHSGEDGTAGERVLQRTSGRGPADRSQDRGRADRFYDLSVGPAGGAAP